MTQLVGFTYDEIEIGQTANYIKTVSEQDVLLFAAVSGDTNPVHLDADYAATTQFGERIAHGMLTGALVSAALALNLPGPGSIYLGQSLKFRAPVLIGDELTINLEVIEKNDRRKQVTIACTVLNQHGKKVATGEASAMPPKEKLIIDKPAAPKVLVE
jgi:3-hydroxybutyryl-CoA dehydratase